MYVRRADEAAIAARSRLTRMNGAVILHSCTSSSSISSTSLTRCTQLLTGWWSGRRPPASIARRAAIRSGEADPAASASAVTACGVGDQCRRTFPLSPPSSWSTPVGPNVTIGGTSPAGSIATSASINAAYASGDRRTVCAALLIRMSSGPCALTESARRTTCAGFRRSMPTMLRRCSQSDASGMAAKRRAASRGNRVVIVVWAPSRRSRSAMYIPILARPPVRSARRPVRSVRAERRWWLSAAQSGQS